MESRNPSATVAAIRQESSLVKNALTTVPILIALRIIIALRYSRTLPSFVKAKSANNKNQRIKYRIHNSKIFSSLIYSITKLFRFYNNNRQSLKCYEKYKETRY